MLLASTWTQRKLIQGPRPCKASTSPPGSKRWNFLNCQRGAWEVQVARQNREYHKQLWQASCRKRKSRVKKNVTEKRISVLQNASQALINATSHCQAHLAFPFMRVSVSSVCPTTILRKHMPQPSLKSESVTEKVMGVFTSQNLPSKTPLLTNDWFSFSDDCVFTIFFLLTKDIVDTRFCCISVSKRLRKVLRLVKRSSLECWLN